MDAHPPQPWSPRFSATARAIAAACRSLGLAVPGFRSPPAVVGADRTLRRWPDGRSVVAVRAAGRAPDAVVRDLVEGVIAVNRLEGGEADRVRQTLVDAAAAEGGSEPTASRRPVAGDGRGVGEAAGPSGRAQAGSSDFGAHSAA